MRAAKLGPILRTFCRINRFVLETTRGRIDSRLELPPEEA